MRRQSAQDRLWVSQARTPVYVLAGYCTNMSGTEPGSVVQPDPGICVRAQNAFGLRLLNELTAQTPKQNVLFSPISVFMGLLLAELGASGATGEAIRQTLYLPAGISSSDMRVSAWAHASRLRSHESIQLSIANAIWADERLPLNPKFTAMAEELYDAKASMLDFSDPGAAQTVNEWLRQATRICWMALSHPVCWRAPIVC